ncbi:MAG: 2OG-Fe(II) oxygenase family protein [Nanoarchaeota archaeon]|nr:2OG-Fe(II) oxygenase family protein [Nanoarchaeota archaeon]
MLRAWINPHYVQENIVQDLRRKFRKNRPFSHLELPGFFKEEKIRTLLPALHREKFYLKNSDLFTFLQTNDFKGTKNRTLQQFRLFLSSPEFVHYISFLSGKKLHHTIDMFGTVYKNTHYLLPHDDQVEDRKIAYFLYFSTLTKKDGGKLLLYASKNKKPSAVAHHILPAFNTFAFFKVSTKSFHEVEEVISATQRVTITGWFHGN